MQGLSFESSTQWTFDQEIEITGSSGGARYVPIIERSLLQTHMLELTVTAWNVGADPGTIHLHTVTAASLVMYRELDPAPNCITKPQNLKH